MKRLGFISSILIGALFSLAVSDAQNLAQREQQAPQRIKAELTDLRTQIKAKQLTFQVGYTTALDTPLEKLATLKLPENLAAIASNVNELSGQMYRITMQAR